MISTILWFAGDAGPAAEFYARVFGGQTHLTVHSTGDGPLAKRAVLGVGLALGGQSIVALNAPADAPFPMGGSMMVQCADQAEIDRLWDALLDGGAPMICGWLKDRFGVMWQIVPEGMGEMLADPDTEASSRLTRAMFGMIKLDTAALQAAFKGAN